MNETLTATVARHWQQCDKVNGRRYDDERLVSPVGTSSGQYRLFITNYNSANEAATLLKHEIVAVLSLGSSNALHQSTLQVLRNEKDAYMLLNVRDEQTLDNVAQVQTSVLPHSRRFLGKWLERGNVLVHCNRGVCRSPLIVLDYLLNVEKCTIEQAARLLTRRRWCVSPQPTLLQALFESVKRQ